jgi:hypothetical protein
MSLDYITPILFHSLPYSTDPIDRNISQVPNQPPRRFHIISYSQPSAADSLSRPFHLPVYANLDLSLWSRTPPLPNQAYPSPRSSSFGKTSAPSLSPSTESEEETERLAMGPVRLGSSVAAWKEYNWRGMERGQRGEQQRTQGTTPTARTLKPYVYKPRPSYGSSSSFGPPSSQSSSSLPLMTTSASSSSSSYLLPPQHGVAHHQQRQPFPSPVYPPSQPTRFQRSNTNPSSTTSPHDARYTPHHLPPPPSLISSAIILPPLSHSSTSVKIEGRLEYDTRQINRLRVRI